MNDFTDVEFEFLLQRPIRRLLTDADRRAFDGRRVFITGAGGSIGSALARQVAALHPASLVLFDQSELALFQIERDLVERHPDVRIETVLADIARPGTAAQACRASRPHVVYHAAAYKHVTMAERAVCAAADANILGTRYAVDAARDIGARFVLISSDKAARPESVMGATKRFAELVVLSRACRTFQPVVVRFGNVLGSSGSVLTIMRERIRQGRPVPLTHPDATRYFMTAGEAVALVMKTELLARRAETYWLDMGDPVRIGTLAERLLALETRLGHAGVGIDRIGLRPGEKLREELTSQGLRMCPTRHRRIWVARQRPTDAGALEKALRALARDVRRGDGLAALEGIGRVVDDFVPSDQARASAAAQSLHASPLAGARRQRTA
ncbi:MAG: polysaccharide biosynthesis protein [Vicinamibacterales bacterium]